jgi:hypothetical protein
MHRRATIAAGRQDRIAREKPSAGWNRTDAVSNGTAKTGRSRLRCGPSQKAFCPEIRSISAPHQSAPLTLLPARFTLRVPLPAIGTETIVVCQNHGSIEDFRSYRLSLTRETMQQWHEAVEGETRRRQQYQANVEILCPHICPWASSAEQDQRTTLGNSTAFPWGNKQPSRPSINIQTPRTSSTVTEAMRRSVVTRHCLSKKIGCRNGACATCWV